LVAETVSNRHSDGRELLGARIQMGGGIVVFIVGIASSAARSHGVSPLHRMWL
jgi:hypothetical protein